MLLGGSAIPASILPCSFPFVRLYLLLIEHEFYFWQKSHKGEPGKQPVDGSFGSNDRPTGETAGK